MGQVIVGAALWLLGVAAVATGILPLADVGALAARTLPVLGFVTAVTIVAELATRAGLFDAIAARLAGLSRGRTASMWLLLTALAVVSTAFLSLDTTAVLLTPVVVAFAVAHRLPPLPFAFVTVVLANTASLFLPVSNLTNLLAAEATVGHDPLAFLALLGPSALAAVVVSAGILTIRFLPTLPSRFPAAPAPIAADPIALRASAIVVAALLPLLLVGLPPWIPATAAAVAVLAIFLWRAPRAVRPALVPWRLLVFAGGLFLATAAAERLGSAAIAGALLGTGDDFLALWRTAGGGALMANGINNLPAYLVLESSAGSPARLAALLVGVNAGPLVTPWASLATLLWYDRLSAAGVAVRWRSFVLLGLVCAPLTITAAVLPLAW